MFLTTFAFAQRRSLTPITASKYRGHKKQEDVYCLHCDANSSSPDGLIKSDAMIEAMRHRPRSALALAFLLGLVISYLINFFLTLCYIALLGGSCALTIGIRRLGIGRQQIFDVLHLPTGARDLINDVLPAAAKDQTYRFQQREALDSFKFVGADLFDMSSGGSSSSPINQMRTRTEQLASPNRQQGKFARMQPSTPGPALSTTRFRSNLNFILDAEVNSPGFTNRVVNYHRQENVSQDSPISPRTQIGEFRNIKLHQESPPTRKMNLSSQVGLPLIISSPVSPPNIYSQCLPPEDKSNQTEPSPSVLEALKEISRKRISNEDPRVPPVAKRYKNDFINSVAEFPAVIKETTSPAPKTVSKRGREHIEVTPEQSQSKSKQARVAKCNEIEASLSSSRMYQEQRATAKKRRATTPQQEPQSKTIKTDELLEKTPEQAAVVVQEDKSSPRPLFNVTTSAEPKPSSDTPKRKIISEEIYSPIKLQEKGKASKLLSQRELREKKLREFYEQLKDYQEPEVVEVEKTQGQTPVSTPAAVTSAITSMSSATTVTTSIQGPMVSSVSPMFKSAPITQQAASTSTGLTTAAVSPATTAPVSEKQAATVSAPAPSFSLSAKTDALKTIAPPAFNFSSNTAAATTSAPNFSFGSNTKPVVTTSAQPTFSFGSTLSTTAAAPVEAPAAPNFNFSSISATPASTTSTVPALFTATTTSAAPALFSASTTATPAFGTSTTSAFAFGGTTATTFGAQTTTLPSFGAASTTSSSVSITSGFGVTTTTASTPAFGTTSTTTPAFGSFGSSSAPLAFPAPNTAAPATFGAPSTTASAAFGASTTAAPASFGASTVATFGATTTAAPAFGAPATTAPPAFGAGTTTAPLGFGAATTAAPPAFGAATTAALPAFGAATTAAPPAFGTSIFGAAATTTTTASSTFGSAFSSSTAFSSGAASPFGGGAADSKPAGFGAFKPTAGTTAAAPTPSFSFNPVPTTTTGGIFGNSFSATQNNTSSSIFGSSAPASSGFGKPPELAPLPTNFKFGGDKTDTSPAAAASIFGVPPTQNPFGGGGSTNTAPAAFSFGQTAQPAAPAFNAAPSTGAFGFGTSSTQQQQQQQSHQPGAFGFSAAQPAQFQSNQPQPGVFTLGTSGNRRPALQARRRR
ncbi:Hypothetical predicted protein [Cloeon dipterum]|uniref:Uncharacterized protein n=1 Tax=Cloeon dipterum TaxID=197152 RepID=A0A8S1DUB8_9INSE|nr:Hypothetical predicted protein [Cloeon dipterum]